MKLLVITPAHDEAANLPAVIDAMAAQRRPPDRWVIVDDHSRDATGQIAEAAAARLPFVRVLTAPAFAQQATDRLALAAEARAFNWALAQCADTRWDVVAKLDADIVLDPAHYERVLGAFAADPRLGVAGCVLLDGARAQRQPAYHVNGAVKTYRREVLDAIGGIHERLAWDTLDETHARMLGWRTASLQDLRALHLRPSGSAGGRLRGRARHGECAWLLNYPPSVVLARTAMLLVSRPPLLAGLAYAGGWLRAARGGRGRVDDARLLAFARDEQRARVRRALRAAFARSGAGAR